MSRDREYDILLNKYNRALFQIKDLKEQLLTKQEQWDKRNEDFDVIEKNVRELCESILAKDPKEMVLGADYSWTMVSLTELVSKAKRVFKEYNKNRTDLMRKIMDESEDRRDQIEGLKEQIVMMKTMGKVSEALSEKEILEQIDRDNEKRKERVKIESAGNAMSVPMQTAIKNDTLDVKMVKESLKNGNASIVEEDWDDEPVTKGRKIEEKVRMNGVKDGISAKITPHSIPVSPAQKVVKAKKALREKADKAYTVNLLSEMEARVSDIGWLAIKIAGETGCSMLNDLINKVRVEQEKEGSAHSVGKVRRNIEDAANIGMFRKELIVTPFGKHFAITLTAEGARSFKRRFKNEPILSEYDRLISEHDNINHGYAIKIVSDLIRETGIFSEVEIWNRKKNEIKVIGDKIVYIPDISCVLNNGEHIYIEYELGHYTQSEFNTKNNKMFAATNYVNYIVPNKEEAEKIIGKLVKWTATLVKNGRVRHLTVRVTTATAVRGQDLTKNSSWMFVYRPSKDKSPINNF